MLSCLRFGVVGNLACWCGLAHRPIQTHGHAVMMEVRVLLYVQVQTIVSQERISNVLQFFCILHTMACLQLPRRCCGPHSVLIHWARWRNVCRRTKMQELMKTLSELYRRTSLAWVVALTWYVAWVGFDLVSYLLTIPRRAAVSN